MKIYIYKNKIVKAEYSPQVDVYLGIPSQSYGKSLAIWDHAVLPATRHK